MADWSRRFDVPVNLPNGKQIVTLSDARKYLLAIPKAKQDAAVEAAVEAVLMAAEGRGPTMHANAGVARVVYGPRPPPEPRPSKKRPWGKVKLLRDR